MSEHKTNEASDAAHLETVAHVKTYDDVELTNAAREGARRQEHLTIRECFKYYPKAIAWSLLVSTCVIMEGYDTILIGNFYAYPTFAHKYGTFDAATKNYQLTAAWQSGLSNASGVGAFFGVLLNGILTSRFGMKRVILASLVILAAFIFMTFLAPNVGVLLAGEILCGLPWGVFATIAPAYASEVLPMPLRVYLTSYTNMCFIIGQLIAAGVLDGLVSNPTQWGYRIPFAIQWVRKS
jgi:SP family general alpha glucoside:H+ symporter-like MFS transporter